jgi:hypothetical protein
MPLFSSDISSMVGGQMAMFSNQAQYAQQVGATAGISPPQMGGGPSMVAPNFGPSYARPGYGGQEIGPWSYNRPGGIGAAAATGIGGAIPGVASGLSLAGGFGLMGHMGGYLDPFTGVGRAFMGGAGGLGGIGGAFAQGGMRAGMGALGGGLAAAALPLAGYYAAGQAISTVGDNIAQGARNITQVGQTAQQFMGPSYGMSGSRPGGQLPRGEIAGIVSALHEIAGQDVMTTMESVKRLMGQATQMGMLTGITDAGMFKQKFSKIVDQVKNVAKIMGTTLEEAAPLLGQMQSMGMWKASDIMGTASALQQVGRGGQQQLMGAMQAGAQGSWQQGGSLAAGANLGRSQFMNVQAMMRSGALSNEQLMEFTGGVGGVEGQQMMAQNMTGMMQRMGRVPVGRALMAGLGEQVNGRFTGRIDQKRLDQFQSGGMSLDDVMNQGYGRTRSREQAASFTFRSDQMGQDLASKGGMELVGQALNQVVERAGYGKASEDIKGLFLQNIMGMNQREAQQWLGLMKELPRILETKAKRERDQLQDAFRRIDETQNRSWQGLKNAVGHAFEERVERPLQSIGENLTTSINDRADSVTDWLYNRDKQIGLSSEGRQRMLLRGGSRQGLGEMGLGGSFREKVGSGTFIEQLRTGSTRAQSLADVGADVTEISTARGGKLGANQLEVGSVDESDNPFSDRASSRRIKAVDLAQAEIGARRVLARAQNATLKGLGYSDSPDAQAAMAKVDSAYYALVYGPVGQRLKKEHAGNPQAFNAAIARELRKQPGMEGAMSYIASSSGNRGGTQAMSDQDLAAISDANLRRKGFDPTNGMDTKAAADQLAFIDDMRDPAKVQELVKNSLSDAYGVLGGQSAAGKGVAQGAGLLLSGIDPTATYGAIKDMMSGKGVLESVGNLFSGKYGVSKALGNLAGEVLGGDVTQGEIDQVLLNDSYGPDLQKWLASGAKGPPPESVARAAVKGSVLSKVMGHITELAEKNPGAVKSLGGAMRGLQRAAEGKEWDKIREERKRSAGAELEGLSGVHGLSEEARGGVKAVLERAAAGEDVSAQLDTLASMKLSSKDESALLASGAYGGEAVGIRRARRLSQNIGKGGLSRDEVMDRIGSVSKALGYRAESAFDLDPEQKKMFEAAFDPKGPGGAKVTKDEMEKLAKAIEENTKKLGPQEAKKAQEAENERMTKLLTGYTEANTRFVTAVDVALGGKVQAAAEEIRNKNIDPKSSNPVGTGT